MACHDDACLLQLHMSRASVKVCASCVHVAGWLDGWMQSVSTEVSVEHSFTLSDGDDGDQFQVRVRRSIALPALHWLPHCTGLGRMATSSGQSPDY